jgi:hypothetical protein
MTILLPSSCKQHLLWLPQIGKQDDDDSKVLCALAFWTKKAEDGWEEINEGGKERDKEGDLFLFFLFSFCFKMSYHYVVFTLDVKSVVNENLGGILGGTHC